MLATAFAGVCVSGLAITGSAVAAPFNLKIVNDSGQDPQNVYVMLHNHTGTAASLDGQLTDAVPKQLSAINNSTVLMGDISAARLFVSYGAPVGPNQANDNSSTTRYDKIEFTNPGVANLTAVDFLGIPFSLQALDSSGDATSPALSYSCYTDTIAQRLRQIAPGAELDYGGQFVRTWSPGLYPEYYRSMAPYLQSMSGQTITIDDRFDSSGAHYAINYTGTFGSDGSITLNGTLTPDGGSAAPGSTVHIDGANLNGISEQGIYTGNGDYTVGGVPAHVGDNDQYSVIYRDIVAGFSLGYWGGKYGNSVSAWKGQPDFAAARTSTSPYATYNDYAAIIADYSYAYGYSFHDMGPTAVAVGLTPSVATLEMVIEPDAGPNVPGCIGTSTPSDPPAPGNSPGGRGGRVSVAIDRRIARLDRDGRALVRLTCKGDPCSGELSMTATEKIERRRARRSAGSVTAARRKKEHEPRRREVLVGRTEFRLSEGESRGFWVKVTRKGKILMRHARDHRLRTLVRAAVGPRERPTIAGKRIVVLEPYKPPRKDRRRR